MAGNLSRTGPPVLPGLAGPAWSSCVSCPILARHSRVQLVGQFTQSTIIPDLNLSALISSQVKVKSTLASSVSESKKSSSTEVNLDPLPSPVLKYYITPLHLDISTCSGLLSSFRTSAVPERRGGSSGYPEAKFAVFILKTS